MVLGSHASNWRGCCWSGDCRIFTMLGWGHGIFYELHELDGWGGGPLDRGGQSKWVG